MPGVRRTYAIHVTVGRPGGIGLLDEDVRDLLRRASVGVHDVDVAVPRERDALAGRLPGRVRVVLLRGGERARAGPVGVHDVDVRRAAAPADERDPRPVGATTRARPGRRATPRSSSSSSAAVSRRSPPPSAAHHEDRVVAVAARDEREVRARRVVAAAARAAERRDGDEHDRERRSASDDGTHS